MIGIISSTVINWTDELVTSQRDIDLALLGIVAGVLGAIVIEPFKHVLEIATAALERR